MMVSMLWRRYVLILQFFSLFYISYGLPGLSNCSQVAVGNSSTIALIKQNTTNCTWRIQPTEGTLLISIPTGACSHVVIMSEYEDFGESFWNSSRCPTNNITSILTATTVYIRLNTSSSSALFNVSRHECNKSYTYRAGNISLQFPEEQLHVTPIVCKYTIELPKYNTIDLKINNVFLRENDTLIVRDRRSEIRKIVGTNTLSENHPNDRIMNTSYIELEYLSSSEGLFSSPVNLNFSWSHCGGIFEDNMNYSTFIESGSSVNVDCTFLLKRKSADKFDFRLTNYSLTTTSCDKDFLQLYDGVVREDQLVKQYCNKSSDDVTHLSTNQIILRLVSTGSDLNITFSGKATPREGCGQSIFYHQGQIVNPSNTLSSSCWYSIITQEDSRIWLVFNNISLPDRSNGICTDYLQVTDVSATGATQRYCSDKYPRHKLLSGNEALIMFHTNGNQDDLNAKFNIEFTECGGHFDGYSGEIKGLQSGSDKDFSEKCVWRIGHPTSQNITIRSLDIFSTYCNKSVKLNIAENESIQLCNYTSNFMKAFGNVTVEIPLAVLLSNSPVLTWIACGAVQRSKKGLTSVDLVLYEYLNDSCPLILDASDTGSYILYLEISNNDCLDGFQIDDYRYSLNSTLFHFPSPVNISFLSTNNTSQECRLTLHWESCNQTFTGNNGTFTSPGFPDQYFVNQTCFYTITAPNGQQINLTFKDFDVGKSTNDKKCGGDRVEIHDAGYVGSREDIHCGKRGKDELIQYLSSGHQLTLRFVSNGNQGNRFKGFDVSYEFFDQEMSTRGQTVSGHSSEYHDIKQGLLSYRTTLATTVAMGVCIGVLVFTVIALAGFLVRQRKRQSVHTPALPQESNMSTSDMNGPLSPQTRKHGYIKKKDSNGLSTPSLGNRQSSLNDKKENSNKNVENKEGNQTKENGIYNHLHDDTKTPTTQKKDDYSSVVPDNKEYSKCGFVPKKFEILGDTVYDTSKPTQTSSDVTTNENKDNVSGSEETSGNQKIQNCESMCGDAKSENSFKEDKLDVDNGNVPRTKGKDTPNTDKSKRKSGVNKNKIKLEKDLQEINEGEESVYSNVDTNSNEYGNWKDIPAETKERNTFIPEEDEFYSNTASIYSNNIQEDVYSNGSSVL